MIPLTFSPSADDDAYAPCAEDALLAGVWLMMRADNINRKKYSYDPDNADAASRIVMDRAAIDESGGGHRGRLIVPQMVVGLVNSANRFDFEIQGGVKTITVAIIHLEVAATEYADAGNVDFDPSAFKETASTVQAHVEELLMRGTVYSPDMDEDRMVGRVIDPFYSPVYTDMTAPAPELEGAYVQGSFCELNRSAPKLSRTLSFWPIPTRFDGDLTKLSPRDIAVGYGVLAAYEVSIADRKNMRRGG